MAKKLPYNEGDWFAVPLFSGGYAAGIIARSAPKGKILFGYFFGPKSEKFPKAEGLNDLKPKDAIFVARFGDLGLTSGNWPIILKTSDQWDKNFWRLPLFKRVDLVSQKVFCIKYDQNDPSKEISAKRSHQSECKNLSED